MNPAGAVIIEGHVQGPEHRLTGLRFNISKPGKAVLHFPSHYSVDKISSGGMLIESNEALEVESRFPMELTIPDEEPISFTGRVASCVLVTGKGVEHFDIGIQFLEMSEADKNKVEEFIALLKAMDRPSPSV